SASSCSSREAVRRFPQHLSAHRASFRESRIIHVWRGITRSFAKCFEATSRRSSTNLSCLARSWPSLRRRLADPPRLSCPRSTAFTFTSLVVPSVSAAWANQNGRPLTCSEEYPVADMRRFRASDEGSVQAPPEGKQPREGHVDESKLEELLGQLGI